jgi:mRNA-degrading endonuclease RelE of RelBE toxin-antitoxin system
VNIEIRKSFEKDAETLPGSVKILLERTIQNIITAKKLSDISSCKKLIGFKNAYRLRIGNYALVSSLKMKK